MTCTYLKTITRNFRRIILRRRQRRKRLFYFDFTVAKLKSIKIFDEEGKNADKALVEINATRYGLEKRTGVDFQTFAKNRMSGQPLKIEDKKVFPEEKERFKLGSHDLSRTLRHTGKAGNKKKKGK